MYFGIKWWGAFKIWTKCTKYTFLNMNCIESTNNEKIVLLVKKRTFYKDTHVFTEIFQSQMLKVKIWHFLRHAIIPFKKKVSRCHEHYQWQYRLWSFKSGDTKLVSFSLRMNVFKGNFSIQPILDFQHLTLKYFSKKHVLIKNYMYWIFFIPERETPQPVLP